MRRLLTARQLLIFIVLALMISKVGYYSRLKASTGVSRDALQAGMMPASAPTAVAMRMAASISSGVTTGVIVRL
ncbi:MAG: hypothetical protein QXJ75_04495 [Candidatus Bathyarchaeia archaeon]